MKKYAGFFVLISIVIACIIPYANSIHNPFIWDEEVIIIGNPVIKHWGFFPLLFKTNIFGGKIDASGYYRPFYMLLFMLDYSIWKLNATGYHITSLVLHILNALLLYALMVKLGLQRKIAWLASLLLM